jgi:arylsulfatase A-like enzyme
MAASIDWMPTIAEYCGVKLPEREIDGKSITSVIESEDAPSPHEVFHWETGKHWAIRQGDWKLVHNGPATDYKGRKIPQVENFLSNMAEDVTETRNLTETYPEKVKQLTKLHEQWLKKLKQE